MCFFIMELMHIFKKIEQNKATSSIYFNSISIVAVGFIDTNICYLPQREKKHIL